MTFQGNIDALPGREVFGSDGRRIGKVGQVFVLEGTDDPTWMTVHTGLFGTHESFVPVAEATERGDELLVPYEKSFVHDAPRIDDASELTVEHEAELYRYYGVQPPMQHGSDAGAQAQRGHRDDEHDAHGSRDTDGSRDEHRDSAAGARRCWRRRRRQCRRCGCECGRCGCDRHAAPPPPDRHRDADHPGAGAARGDRGRGRGSRRRPGRSPPRALTPRGAAASAHLPH